MWSVSFKLALRRGCGEHASLAVVVNEDKSRADDLEKRMDERELNEIS